MMTVAVWHPTGVCDQQLPLPARWLPLTVFTRGGQRTAAMLDSATPDGRYRIVVDYSGTLVTLIAKRSELRPVADKREAFELFLLRNGGQPTWTKRNGTQMRVCDMDDDHLENSIAMLAAKRFVLVAERNRRLFDRSSSI